MNENTTSKKSLQQQHGGHWGAHPEHPVEDWMYEVANGDTREGYWEWVQRRVGGGDEVYVVVYSHRHGVDTWLLTERKTEGEVIEELREDGEWDEREDQDPESYVEVRGPFQV